MLELRNITSDEFERWMRTESRERANRLAHDPEHLRPRFELGRFIAEFEDGHIVGGAHSHLLERMNNIRSSPNKSTVLAFADLPRGISRYGRVC